MSSKLQILLTIIPSFILLLNSSKIGNKIGLMDFPDNKRKIHKNPVPKVGGIIVPVSFWKCLPFLLTFSSLKLKKWNFSSDKNAKISICQYFLDIISKP